MCHKKEKFMMVPWICIATVYGLIGLTCALVAAQTGLRVSSPPPASGAQTYRQYCAVCHGKTGKGNGPAASSLKVQPPDLTKLRSRHGGEFPKAYVLDVLRNGVKATPHGTPEMPIWGPLFQAIDSSYQSQVNLRMRSLVNYIRSLQSE